MANRYWVGDTADWDGTPASKWALTSGGAGGEAVPTASDDVFFDAASGSVVVTMGTTDGVCLSLNCTGFTGTLRDNASGLNVRASGNVTLGSGMTWNFTGGGGLIMAASGTLITNGVTMTGAIRIFGGATLTLGSAVSITGTLLVGDTGIVDCAGFAFTTTNTANGILCSVTGSLTMGASTVTTPKITMGAGGALDFGSGTLGRERHRDMRVDQRDDDDHARHGHAQDQQQQLFEQDARARWKDLSQPVACPRLHPGL